MFKLLILLNFCHLLGDFSPLSTAWMLNAKRFGKPLFPIFVHAAVHASLMLSVLFFFTELKYALLLAGFQLITHFIIDVWKGRMNGWFPVFSDMNNKAYWFLFGFDQLLHQMVILTMVWYMAQ